MTGFKLAGVMGWPVAHSRSPTLHGHWLERYSIRGAYVPLPVRPEHLGQALHALPVLGFAGCNVTVPHKEAAIEYLDHVDALSHRIGSVNTVIVREDGTLEGRSTDGYGFIENLHHRAPEWSTRGGRALIIGAGGSARAIAFALANCGVGAVTIVNRTQERVDRLVSDIGGPLSGIEWDQRELLLPECHLLVNTTTQGMTGQPPLDIDIRTLPQEAVVADIVYTPLETPLLKQAKLQGNRTVDGLGMLLHQARPGFAAWFGTEPEVDEQLRSALIRSLGG